MGRISQTISSCICMRVVCLSPCVLVCQCVNMGMNTRGWCYCLPPLLCLSTLTFETGYSHWSWSPQKGQPSRPVGSGNRAVFNAGVSVLPSSSVLGCCGPSLGLMLYQAAISPAFHNCFLWRNRDNISRSGTNIFRLSIRKYLEIWLEKKPWFLWNFLYCLWQYPLI